MIDVTGDIRTTDNNPCRIDTDRFYTTVDNCYEVYNLTGNFLYGTVRKDRFPQYSILQNQNLSDGEFVWGYCHLPMPMMLYR